MKPASARGVCICPWSWPLSLPCRIAHANSPDTADSPDLAESPVLNRPRRIARAELPVPNRLCETKSASTHGACICPWSLHLPVEPASTRGVCFCPWSLLLPLEFAPARGARFCPWRPLLPVEPASACGTRFCLWRPLLPVEAVRSNSNTVPFFLAHSISSHSAESWDSQRKHAHWQ